MWDEGKCVVWDECKVFVMWDEGKVCVWNEWKVCVMWDEGKVCVVWDEWKVWNEGKVCVVGVLMDLHTTGGHHEGGRERYTQGESGSYAEEI